ncbi:MAG: tetratricopeptide repeat protein [Pseudomonadota bacterium]
MALIVFSLSGCNMLGLGDDEAPRKIKSKGPTLGQKLTRLPDLELEQVAQRKPTRAEVMAAYNRVYGLLADGAQNHAIGKRLADLHMDVGQDKDIEGADEPYGDAVALYEKLLVDNTAEGTDAILYQLARAHDLSGRVERMRVYLDRLIDEFPDSDYVPEARFRRAELRFSAEDYRAAADDYQYVVQLGGATPYYRNASYMLGWAEFKRMRFDEGLTQFFNVVDDLLEERAVVDLSNTEGELLKDTFRVVNLAISYLDGPITLADEMRRRDKPAWQYVAYKSLADDFFERERYLDNVATWQTFIEHNPLDARAPAAHKGMIVTLKGAGFPSDVLDKKTQFIRRYGVYSEFWTHHDDAVRGSYLSDLHEYLSEVAKLAHASAQLFDADKKAQRRQRDPQAHRTQLYLTAAEWYEEMTVTFPADPRTAEYLFLLGETFTEAQEHGKAVAAYQRVVRDFVDYVQAPEAGYAAILGLDHLVGSASPGELELWQRLKIDAQIEFALLFSGDPRAPAVQTDAADTLFSLGHMDEALDLAENLLAEWPDVAAPLRKTALSIIGHARFERGEYVAAETAYVQLLDLAADRGERDQVNERLLATVYKQGEQADADGDVELAVSNFLRLASIAPASQLAAQGHFDAVAVLESAKATARAAELLQQFRVTYPGHKLGRDIDLRLAAMYEETENYAAAAVEYVSLSQGGQSEDVRRQSLYRAAELYLEMQDTQNAIAYFRDYAHTYKQPADLRLEAMHHMDELYQLTGELDKRAFWLRQKIKLHKDLGGAATDRSRYLAASAQFFFAGEAQRGFAAVTLKHPLQRSLKKKQKALKQALRAFEATAKYEVEEFTTASTFEIANLYVVLAQDIMASSRPKNLNELELEQYEILLEEQAFPFEEQAISLHQINMQRAWEGVYDDWVQRSFTELARLMPGRFNKPELEVQYASAIH